ncbi:Resolvase RNase H domain protein fold protein [Stanieria cyanosphaera PCC 7437]|uniref:Resolvase RNase H domain protein fold protein n=1 Tax=Stanieria cyanosphaera (strain ATCC 29371 / PCC 7437) TaxID=111780 RepID=K9XMH4_STAC7|nr:pre-16S rRNA-processing nuclease YqgF [Stanieria cyanosphaera]AFZ33805.1 Resolvase RNase H domain protein fold protein [Stanieria cyanosphaera PCC 7437]
MILGFDPGRDKCGIAVMNFARQIVFHQVVDSQLALADLQKLCQQYEIKLIVMGNLTTAKSWRQKIESELSFSIPLVMVDENNSSVEARERYWQMYPPRGLKKLIPQGMRIPPRPVDDIVAILLIERYLATSEYGQ